MDGDFTISQSVAANIYVGDKLGLNRGINSARDRAKAVQYMQDASDLVGEFFRFALGAAAAGPTHDLSALKTFVEGGRLTSWLTNIEHSIRGPFYFGTHPTYVDFYLLQNLDWMDDVALDKLRAKASPPLLPERVLVVCLSWVLAPGRPAT